MENNNVNDDCKSPACIFISLIILLGILGICYIFYDKYIKKPTDKIEIAAVAVVDSSVNKTFYPPKQSPFHNNVGICFSVEATQWFTTPPVKYSQALQNKYTFERLEAISKHFKLIRIYSYLVAGFEQTGTLSPEGYALTRIAKQDASIEAVVATSNNIAWYMVASNVQQFVDTMQNEFGSSISQVKTILIGNEVNTIPNFTPSQLSTVIGNFKIALKNNSLTIPVTVSFNSLPNQQGDAFSDSLVAKVMQNWDTTWNGNNQFVFIDPYPDGMVGGVSGVYKWQYQVTKYYKTLHPSLQIFIAETGAEGSASDASTVVTVDSIFYELNNQYTLIKKTVPTFMFEAVNEPLKPAAPNQQFMGIYTDSSDPKKVNLNLKSGVTLPTWIK